jgi:hypothetical protein
MFALVAYGSGVASADPLLGKTYSDASAVASGWNRDVVIETVAGSRLAQADCIVASWRKWDKRDADGNVVKQVLMNLNCNQGLASAGNPGNSLASPEGRQRAKDNVMAAGIAKNDKDCHQSDAAMAWCQALCHRTGLCNEDA